MSDNKPAVTENNDNKQVLKFGNGEITLNFNNQVLQNVRAGVILSEASGDFHTIQRKSIISANGYKKLNRVAGINIVSPPTLWWNEKEVSNPYPIQGSEPGTIKAIMMRRLGIGYSPIGNLVVIDKSLYFNIFTYFTESLMKLAKDKPAIVKLGLRYMCPFMPTVTPQKGEEGEYYVIDSENQKIYRFIGLEQGTGVWFDMSASDILDAYQTNSQRQKFAERIGQTILDRNILKDHPCIGISQVLPQNGFAQVDVYGWRHALDRKRFDQVTKNVLNGDLPDDTEYSNETVSVDGADGEDPDIGDVISEETVYETPQKPQPENVSQEFDEKAEDDARLNAILELAKKHGIGGQLTDLAQKWYPDQKLLSYKQLSGDYLMDFQDTFKSYVEDLAKKKKK